MMRLNLACGFGLDPLTKDYKVVFLRRYSPRTDGDISSVHCRTSSALVYSLRTDSWKYCGDLSRKYVILENKCHIFVNECLYWHGVVRGDESNGLIMSFNVAVDALQEIQVPNYGKQASTSLAIYHDSMAFYTVCPRLETEKCFDIWTFNEGFWTKEISHPIGHLKKDEAILQRDDGSLVLFDPDTEKMWEITGQFDNLFMGFFIYMESLVSIKALSNRTACCEEDEHTLRNLTHIYEVSSWFYLDKSSLYS